MQSNLFGFQFWGSGTKKKIINEYYWNVLIFVFIVKKIFWCSITNFALFALHLIWCLINYPIPCFVLNLRLKLISLDENDIFFHSFFTFWTTKIICDIFKIHLHYILQEMSKLFMFHIFFEVRYHVFKKIPISILFHMEFFLNTAAGNFYNIFFFKNLPWFKLFNVWVLLSNWQWFRFVPANQSDEGEQYVPGYNGGSKGGRSSGMLHALFF